MEFTNISFPFPNIRDEALEASILPYVNKIRVRAKETFLHPNDELACMYYIHSGSTRHFTTSPDGIEKILYVLSDGWFFGEPWFFLGVKTGLSTTAETDLELWSINYDELSVLLGKNDELRRTTYQCLTYKTLFLRYEIENLCFNSCQDRLMRTICMCVDQSNVIDNSWYGLKIQYTHYDLGVLIGSVRVTVSKLMNKLCAEGSIRIVNHRIQVDIEAYHKYMKIFFGQFTGIV